MNGSSHFWIVMLDREKLYNGFYRIGAFYYLEDKGCAEKVKTEKEL